MVYDISESGVFFSLSLSLLPRVCAVGCLESVSALNRTCSFFPFFIPPYFDYSNFEKINYGYWHGLGSEGSVSGHTHRT